jgi:uncharacterized protein
LSKRANEGSVPANREHEDAEDSIRDDRVSGGRVLLCLFATDLHGRIERYEKLFAMILRERPAALFLGGDLLPSGWLGGTAQSLAYEDFIADYFAPHLAELRKVLGHAYPEVFVILGNDDPGVAEAGILEAEGQGLLRYAHLRRHEFRGFPVYGYACVPPTPFLLKDWERYDVSRYVDPGCLPPEEGYRSNPLSEDEIRSGTIQADLARLTNEDDLARAIFLFHTPPYDTILDLADLAGQMVDHVPLDPHVGSIAVRRFLEQRGPLLSLHGHVHEAARLSGAWRMSLGRTHAFNAAHDGPELAVVRFDPEDPIGADRRLV